MNALSGNTPRSSEVPSTGVGPARSVGFPRSGYVVPTRGASAATSKASVGSKVAVVAPPKPLAKRPKGRWFISLVILSIMAFAIRTVWCEFIRYQAYGQIEGRVIRLSPITSGVITSIVVRDGDQVQPGELLATIENFELKRDREKLESELQIARVNLEIRLAEIKASRRLALSDCVRREVEYYELLGDLHNRQAQIEQLRQVFESRQQLRANNAVSESEFVAAKAAYDGQKSQIAEMKSAVETLHSAIRELTIDNSPDLIGGELARLRAIQLKQHQNDELREAFEVRAPAAGRIVRRNHFSGEFVRPESVLFELLEEGSLSAVLFFPQNKAASVRVGDEVKVVVQPNDEYQRFVISRVADQVVQPPPSLMRLYQANQALVPVYAVPVAASRKGFEDDSIAWIGAVVALPRFGFRGSANHYRDRRSLPLGLTPASQVR